MKNKFLKLDIKYIFSFLFVFFILFNFCYVEGSTYTVRTDEFNAVAIYPDTEPPTIELSYTPDTPTNGSVTINADVTDPLGVAETRYATSESKASTGTLLSF